MIPRTLKSLEAQWTMCGLKVPLGLLTVPQQPRSKKDYSAAKETAACYFRKGLEETSDTKTYKPVTHVIFGLDGSVLSSEDIIRESHIKFLTKFKKHYSRSLQELVMGRREIDGAQLIVDKLSMPIGAAVYVHGVWQLQRCMFPNIPDMQGVHKLICHFKKHKVPIALASSTASMPFKAKTKNHRALMKLFCHIVLGDDKEVKKGKPHPDLFTIARKRFRQPPCPDKVLAIEDSPAGVAAAKAAGFQVVMIPDPCLREEATKGADLVIKAYSEFRPDAFGLPPMKK